MMEIRGAKMKSKNKGFTLIELMIVISIIWILATMAMPSFQDQIIKTQVQEGINLTDFARKAVEDFYGKKKRMPLDNKEAKLPSPEKIIGNYVTRVEVNSGVINIKFGNRINKNAENRIMSIRPAIVKGEPRVPIAWVYGYASVPDKMTITGKNRSDIQARFLPVNCRY